MSLRAVVRSGGNTLPRTRYKVTAQNGRIGKARQIEPFEIEVKALPHNLDKMRDEVCRAISRFARTKGLDVVLSLPPGTAAIYGDVYSNLSNTPIGRIRFDLIKE